MRLRQKSKIFVLLLRSCFRCNHCTSSLPKCSARLQVHSLHLISTEMLCRASGAFTAPHLHRNTLQGFRCIHCTSSPPEYSAKLQVHSLHLISTEMLHRTSGAFTAPHLLRNTLPDFRCIHCTSSLLGNSISFRCNECT